SFPTRRSSDLPALKPMIGYRHVTIYRFPLATDGQPIVLKLYFNVFFPYAWDIQFNSEILFTLCNIDLRFKYWLIQCRGKIVKQSIPYSRKTSERKLGSIIFY